ncbi:MAG: hypothetical protein ABI707_11225 [Ferruginibacter sp.]
MKIKIGFVLFSTILMSCGSENADNASKPIPKPIMGTWQLITGTLIEKGVTTSTDYTKNTSFIKIINDTHFAFLQHDLNKGKDSAAVYVSGGGSYTLADSLYTEHLEYCSDRKWEGNDFAFTITIKGDTLIQSGIEKVESEGINRVNVEKYIKVKK